MFGSFKKRLVLIVISGLLLLVALFHAWRPGTSSGVDIRPRLGSAIEKILIEKIQDSISDYQDISYNIKEDVAWWVVNPTNLLCLSAVLNFHLVQIKSYFSSFI